MHGSRGDRDFAIYEEYDDVEGSADLANPTTNLLVETVSHDGVNVTPVIKGNQYGGCPHPGSRRHAREGPSCAFDATRDPDVVRRAATAPL